TNTATGTTPTGRDQFYIDGRPFGDARSLVDGTAVSDADSTLSLGPHIVSAVYTSDADFVWSLGQLAGGFLVRAVTSTTRVASSASLEYGQPVSFTATVSDQTIGAATPGGMVDFTDATTGVDLGRIALRGGTAILPPVSLGVGTHEIVAT